MLQFIGINIIDLLHGDHINKAVSLAANREKPAIIGIGSGIVFDFEGVTLAVDRNAVKHQAIFMCDCFGTGHDKKFAAADLFENGLCNLVFHFVVPFVAGMGAGLKSGYVKTHNRATGKVIIFLTMKSLVKNLPVQLFDFQCMFQKEKPGNGPG